MYIKWTRKLETKLYNRNPTKGMNNWALNLVRYSEPILQWTRGNSEKWARVKENLGLYTRLYGRELTETDSIGQEKKEEGSLVLKIVFNASIRALKKRQRLITTASKSIGTKKKKKKKQERLENRNKKKTTERVFQVTKWHGDEKEI